MKLNSANKSSADAHMFPHCGISFNVISIDCRSRFIHVHKSAVVVKNNPIILTVCLCIFHVPSSISFYIYEFASQTLGPFLQPYHKTSVTLTKKA